MPGLLKDLRERLAQLSLVIDEEYVHAPILECAARNTRTEIGSADLNGGGRHRLVTSAAGSGVPCGVWQAPGPSFAHELEPTRGARARGSPRGGAAGRDGGALVGG